MKTTLATLVLSLVIGSPVLASPREPLLFVVVVDTSLTMTDFEPCKAAYDQVLDNFMPGDEMILVLAEGRVIARGQTGDSGTHSFRELVGNTKLREVERQSVDRCTISRAQFDCDEDLTKARLVLRGAFDKALAQPRSDKTELLFTVDEVAKYFADARGRKPVLIFLSDMMEDSSVANFERVDPTPLFTERYIAKRKKTGLPRLQNVRVFVAGVASESQQKVDAVRNFWIRYLSQAGATVNAESYGNRLFGFDYKTP